MVRALDQIPHPAGELVDVDRYLNCGPDLGALAVLAADTPTMKGYLYSLHEAVELGPLRVHLDTPTPRKGGFKRDSTHVTTQVGDLWKYNFDHNMTFKQAVHPADHEARKIESLVEVALIRLFLGVTVALNALVWTIETKPGATSGWEDRKVREPVAALLGGLPEPTVSEGHAAMNYRRELWALRADNVVARTGSVPELAFALWKARTCPRNDDQRDWFAAVEFSGWTKA